MWLGGAAFGHASTKLLFGEAFAAFGLSAAFVETLVDRFAVAEEPIVCCLLGYEEI
jgi:hypothetical protein